MALDLSSFGVMDHLWETLDKTPDGKHIRYLELDVEQLWWMGFVDTQNIPLEDWVRIFEPYRQEDGAYILNREQFLSLEQYRYTGEIRIPFDPMLINEGKYTEKGLDELVEASVAPSCCLPKEALSDFFAQLKKEFRQQDGLILIRRPAKERIKALLDEHPSPLRNLEMMIENMLAVKGDEIMATVKEASDGADAVKAAHQASRFSSSPVSMSEQKARGLEALQKARKRAAGVEVEGAEKVELKRVRRSRRGMRG